MHSWTTNSIYWCYWKMKMLTVRRRRWWRFDDKEMAGSIRTSASSGWRLTSLAVVVQLTASALHWSLHSWFIRPNGALLKFSQNTAALRGWQEISPGCFLAVFPNLGCLCKLPTIKSMWSCIHNQSSKKHLKNQLFSLFPVSLYRLHR